MSHSQILLLLAVTLPCSSHMTDGTGTQPGPVKHQQADSQARTRPAARLTLPWQWEWDEPAHTLTWGTSSWQNCSTLDPNSTRDCLDSV
eukprot:COSAG02_NODE_56734_length_284_cov_0.643243_1_plen_88_part_01